MTKTAVANRRSSVQLQTGRASIDLRPSGHAVAGRQRTPAGRTDASCRAVHFGRKWMRPSPAQARVPEPAMGADHIAARLSTYPMEGSLTRAAEIDDPARIAAPDGQ